jgi:hypothetical protein
MIFKSSKENSLRSFTHHIHTPFRMISELVLASIRSGDQSKTMMVSKPQRRGSHGLHQHKSWSFLTSLIFIIPTVVTCLSLHRHHSNQKSPLVVSSSFSCHRRDFLQQQTAAAMLVTIMLGGQPAFAATTGSMQQQQPMDSPQLSFRAATEDQPRIPLPDSMASTSTGSGPQPVVQGRYVDGEKASPSNRDGLFV